MSLLLRPSAQDVVDVADAPTVADAVEELMLLHRSLQRRKRRIRRLLKLLKKEPRKSKRLLRKLKKREKMKKLPTK